MKPWLPEGAIEFMDQILREANNQGRPVNVLEHGAGESTVWLAERADYVLSFEGNPKWYNQVGNWLRDRNLLGHVSLVFAGDIPYTGVKLPRNAPQQYSLIFVDGRGRIKFWEKTQRFLAPGGWLCWDDAERPKYWRSSGLSSGFLARADDWVMNPQGEEIKVPGVEVEFGDLWPVFAFGKPEKPGSYTLFARKPDGPIR